MTAEQIAAAPRMSFAELIAAVREPNTAPGGPATVDWWLQHALFPPGGRFLDVGCATGSTALRVATLYPASTVFGVDSNGDSIAAANDAADDLGAANAFFLTGDARAMPFLRSNAFDATAIGNVPAFVPDPAAIIREAVRVSRGAVLAAPMWYWSEPPEPIRAAVEKTIGAPIPVRDERHWLDLYASLGLAVAARSVHGFRDVDDDELLVYAHRVIDAPANRDHDAGRRAELTDALVWHYRLFNQNMRCLRFTRLVLRAVRPDEPPVLFTATE